MKIYKTSGKTYRDSKEYVTIYHVSPNKLSRISPMSKFYGKAGAFFSPSYRSIAHDWAVWVASKKKKSHPLKQQWSNLWDRVFELEEIDDLTPEQQKELEFSRNKIEKLRDSIENVSKTEKGYSKVFVHKVACPTAIFEKYQKNIQEKQKEDINLGNMGFWLWGEQIFINAEDLNKLKIVKIEEWDQSKVMQEEKDSWNRRYLQTTWDKPQNPTT
jgi:hypothetical protein